MKILNLSIIATVISFALIVVIIPSSLADQAGLTIGTEQNEVGVGEPISFFVEISSPLQNSMYPTAVIVDEQNRTVWSDDDLPPNGYKGMTKVYYVQRDSENVPVINQTGKYTLIVTFGDKKASNDLTVTELIRENSMLHYYGAYTGIDKENTSAEIANQTYYLTTIHKTPSDLTAPNDAMIQFHGVAFTFPGCGQCLPMPTVPDPPYYVHVQFQDKTNETLEIRGNQWSTIGPPMDFHEYLANGTKIFPNGTRGTWAPRFHMDPIVTVFSNHEQPRAGITVTHDSVKFLVSVENNLSQQSVSLGNVANSTGSENQSMVSQPGNHWYGGGGPVVTITLDPLEQFKSGIPAKNITCQKDFVLIIKSEDNSPACVYASHAAQLLIRGWAESENQKTNLQNTIKVTGYDSSVTYDITGGKLLGIVRDSQGERLFIPIQSNTNGNVKLTLPRSVIDTNPDYKNDTFYIMTNSGSIGIFDETDTLTERIITIPFEKGDNMIQMSVMSWVKEMASTGLGLNKTVTNTICDVPYDPGTGHSSPLYDNGTILHTGYTPVLYMPIDSTGKICVQYYHSASQSNVGARVFDANNLVNDTNNVSISSLQNTIMTGNTTVVYTVNTGHKAGFYGISFFCGGQAFAVGYDNQSKIVLDDFPWYGQTFYCPLQTYEYKITGLHNVGVYYIKTVSHEQLLYDIANTTVMSVHLTPTSQNVTFSLHVRSFDKPVDFVFDYKDSLIDQFKTNPGFVKSFDVCNWNVANRDLVKSFQMLRLGQISVSDTPVTFKPWSNGTYTFSIITKGLDDGYYGLNPVVYGRPAGITTDNTGINYVAYDYPVTIGLGSNVDPSGVCNR